MNTSSSKPKVLIVHRFYRLRGGEDAFLTQTLLPSLERTHIENEAVLLPPLFSKGNFLISVFEFIFMTLGFEKLRPSYFQIKNKILKFQPTTVIFNSFIPTVSLELPSLCVNLNIKSYWWAHNARLGCANGLLYDGIKNCHECFTQGSHRVLGKKCFNNPIQKFIYGHIYSRRRVSQTLAPHLTGYITSSNYSTRAIKEVLTGLKIQGKSFEVIHHQASAGVDPLLSQPERFKNIFNNGLSGYFLFVGRVSFEKGADIFIQLAQKYKNQIFVLAGSGPMEEELKKQAPSNVFFCGFVSEEEKTWLYAHADALVVPSRVPENASLVVFESHPFKTPIIYPKGGGAEESVKWLGRAGCSLDEYQGQKFEKGVGRDFDSKKGFDRHLQKLLSL